MSGASYLCGDVFSLGGYTFPALQRHHLKDGILSISPYRKAGWFAAEHIDKRTVFWYPVSRLICAGWDGEALDMMSWCGAMAAQLICNQWVAGSTPVTSSKKNRLDP